MQSTLNLTRGNLSDLIMDTLRTMIVDGRLPAGERISEVHLARELGVSRTPLREALARLSNEGALDAVPRIGYFVRALTVSEFEQIYSIRPILEPEALRLAGLPSREKIERLRDINDTITGLTDPEGIIAADDEWHIELIAECANGVLVDLVKQFVRRTHRYEIALMRERKNALAAAMNHRSIIAALKRGDLHAACAALRANLQSGKPRILAWLESRAAQGMRISALILTCCFAASHANAQATARPDDSLIGIWGSESTIGPLLRGPITLARNGGQWRAIVSSVETSFTPRGDSIRFSFAGGLGEFRGRLTTNGRTVEGWWIQPDGTKQEGPHDPGGLSQPFASRVTLMLSAPNVWQGSIVPLDDTFTLYLNIWRGPEGFLIGAFRNPELNLRGGSPQFRVTLVNDSAIFTARPDSSEPELRRVAVYDSAHKQLDLWWPQIERRLILFPRTAGQAVAYFPRLPRDVKYSYMAPSPLDDGISSARASSVGLDEPQLEHLVQRIIDTVQTNGRTPLIHSLLIARKGKLVLEEYFSGFDRDKPHDTRSATKTFSSVLLGAAMYQGFPIGPESSITRLLASRGPFANPDPRKNRITLAHLMTHGSGLDCDDNIDESPGNEYNMQSQTAQPDWWKYMLDLRMTHDPGTHWAYCSGSMNLVGAGIAAGTKTWLPDLFDRSIARPLQFGHYYWNLMPTGEGYTGGGVFMRPRDLLKIGQLYLNGGAWNGKRIVSKEWVAASTRRQTGAPDSVTSASDGYAWHRIQLKSGERTYREYEANGNGGQFLIVLPELDLVVVFTAGNYSAYNVWGRFRNDLVANTIIPAIIRR